MRAYFRLARFWCLAGLALHPLFSLAATKPADVAAVVDGFQITAGDVQRKLPELGKSYSKSNADELKREAVEELINEYLAKQRARSVVVENDSAFLRRADYLLSQLAAQEVFNREVVARVAVTDSEAAERYRQNPDRYQIQEWARARHILVSPVTDTSLLSDRQRKTGWWASSDAEAKMIADSLYRLLSAGASFDSLAELWSQDMASGIKGGDLGLFHRGQMVPEFDSVAFRIPVGDVSPPVKSRFGYHLILVTSRQPKKTAPLDDSLKAVLKQEILKKKIIDRSYAFLDSLIDADGVVFNEQLLTLPDSAAAARGTWAAVSAAGDTVWSDRYAAQLAYARSIAPSKKSDRDLKIDLLKETLTPLLLRRAAQKLNITNSQEFLAQKEQIFQNEKINRVYQGAALEYTPAAEEIEGYYREHKADFMPAESISVHVQQMVFKTKAAAEGVLRELEGGADFALLARKYFPGDEEVGKEAFDLGFVSRKGMSPGFFDVAETLTVGTYSRPVKTEWGYHLLRVLARRPDLTLEEARPKIIAAIRRAKQEEHKKKWEADLRAGHSISIKGDVLKRIKYEPPQAADSDRP